MPAFPTSPIIDDFDRPDEGNLLPPWQRIGPPVNWGLFRLHNESIDGNVSFQNGQWKDDTFTTDCEVYADVVILPLSGDECGCLAHVRDTSPTLLTWDGYMFRWSRDATPNYFSLQRITNGLRTVLAQTNGTIAAGDALGMSIISDTIRCYARQSGTWNQVLSDTTDATYADGYLGLYINGKECVMDNVGGGPPVESELHLLPLLGIGA